MREGIGNKGFIKGLLLLAAIVGVVFVGISFGKPYFRYNTLRSHTKDFLMSDIANIEMIKDDIRKNAAELKIPLDDENLQVVVQGKVVKVKATWSETVNFWDYYQKKLDFVMEVEY